MSVFTELQRRNVLRMAGLYLVGAWLAVQVSSTLLPMFGAPAWVPRAFVIALVLGFLPVLALSWIYEVTPDGLKRDSGAGGNDAAPHTGLRIQQLTLVLVVLGLAYLALDRFVLTPHHANTTVIATDAAPGAARTAGDASIAVLPFVNMSSDKEQEYFSDGIAEELLNQLAQIPQLRVVARTSSFAFKGKEVGVAEIAKQLNVANVLEGSIRKSGSKIRITAQLIRSSDSSHLWSETYDRDESDIFAVQDEISAAVVEQLKLKLLGAAPKAHKTDPRAFALYLQGRNSWRQGTPPMLAQAIEQLQEAVRIDPAYADAWSSLSLAYIIRAAGPGDGKLALEAAQKALAADPHNASAHARLANVAENYHNDLATAAEHLKPALAFGPTNNDVIDEVGNLYRLLGRADKAVAFHQYAAQLDPMSPYAHFHLSGDYAALGKLDEAITSGRVSVALSPNFEPFRYGLMASLLLKGDANAVLAELATWPDGPSRRLGLTQAQHLLGNKAASEAALSELLRQDSSIPSYVAIAMALRGDSDRAFAALQRVAADNPALLQSAGEEPTLASLRKDPRWLPLLRKAGQAPEQLSAIRFDAVVPVAR